MAFCPSAPRPTCEERPPACSSSLVLEPFLPVAPQKDPGSELQMSPVRGPGIGILVQPQPLRGCAQPGKIPSSRLPTSAQRGEGADSLQRVCRTHLEGALPLKDEQMHEVNKGVNKHSQGQGRRNRCPNDHTLQEPRPHALHLQPTLKAPIKQFCGSDPPL